KEQYLAKRTPAGYARDLADRFNQFTSFFLSVTLLVPLVALPWIVRRPWLRFAFLTCAALLAALSVTTWFQPHYAAPIVAPLFALVVQGLRYVRLWRWDGRPIGRLFVRAVPWAYLGLLLVAVAVRAQTPNDSWHLHRARLLARFEQDGNRHLV